MSYVIKKAVAVISFCGGVGMNDIHVVERLQI